MNVPNISANDELRRRRATDEWENRTASATRQATETLTIQASAVSWGAIIAGAVGASALALILTMLGTGLGLSSVSPWEYSGISAQALGISAILWLTLTQIVSSGLGGYLAGRLRTKWAVADPDEIYFRDTAHGFLSWAVSALITAALLTSAIGSIVRGTAQAGGTAIAATGSAAATAGAELAKYNTNNEPMQYYIDSLFRRDSATMAGGTTIGEPASMPTSQQTSEQSTAELSRIFINNLRSGPLPPQDVRYAGQIVAQHTGLPQTEAEKRVVDTYNQVQAKRQEAENAAKEIADSARKASVYTSLWFFISLLIGAFCASYAATYGGRQRDMM